MNISSAIHFHLGFSAHSNKSRSKFWGTNQFKKYFFVLGIFLGISASNIPDIFVSSKYFFQNLAFLASVFCSEPVISK